MRIYLAGGWFSPQQEEEHTRIAKLLEQHFDVFNPRTASIQTDVQNTAENILLTNLNGIKRADVVVCITDYKDMGTLWESGYAYANKKVVVYYAETLGNHGFNLMLAKTGYVTQSENALIQKLHELEKHHRFKKVYDDYKGIVE